MSSVSSRIRQGLAALFSPRQAIEIPSRWADQVPEPVHDAWRCLTPYDQHHLIRVATELERQGYGTSVVLAGLLHDIGKHGHVSIVARVVTVLITSFTPGIAGRIRLSTTCPPGTKGLHLLLTHPQRGAQLLEQAGMCDRVVWLVRHHEASLPDSGLVALQVADNDH